LDVSMSFICPIVFKILMLDCDFSIHGGRMYISM
jgi:hypothetical protein